MAGEKIIFSMEGVNKIYPPNKQVLKNIYLSFYYGAKIGVLGLNGAGKSSLLRIIAGTDQNYQGKVVFDKDYKIGMLEQEPHLDPDKTVRQVVEEGVGPLVALIKDYEEVCNKLAEPLEDDEMNRLIDRQAELMDQLDQQNAWELDHKLNTAMEALRCPEENQVIKVLSGGEKRRVALCRLLLSNPDILLLDEPTNHLDAESVLWLEQYLQNFPDISWTMRQAGYWNLIGERASLTKAITAVGWNKKPSDWRWKKNKKPNAKSPWSGNWSGYACHPKPDNQRARPVSMLMTN